MQIIPTKITDYSRTDAELQAFWLFCIFVAGKNADHAGRCVAKVLAKVGRPDAWGITHETPFALLNHLGETGIHNLLLVHRVGQYTRVTRAILESLHLDLRTASIEDLEKVFGVGPKTARFFVLHSRAGACVAVLDTHILRWLREHDVEDAPKSTPNRKHYARFEATWLTLYPFYFPCCTPAEADLLIWCQYSGRFDGEDFPEPRLPGEEA